MREAIATVAAEYDVMTVRQLYYQMEMRGYVGKTEEDMEQLERETLQSLAVIGGQVPAGVRVVLNEAPAAL